MSRDHSIECERCGESYGGMNAESEEHECGADAASDDGICSCSAYMAGECVCGAWDDARDDAERELDALRVSHTRILSALRSLLPIVERVGYSTHEEQAAIREARAVVGDVER